MPLQSVGFNAASSNPMSVSSGGANTKGSYVEAVDPIPFDCDGISLIPSLNTAATVENLLDVAIGAASSEIVVIPNIMHSVQASGAPRAADFIHIRKYLPKGARLSIRMQSTNGSASLGVGIILHSGGLDGREPFQVITAYGANTADSGGTSVDPGGTSNTKGAYTELVASTDAPIEEFYLAIGNQLNQIRSSSLWLLDVAVGGAGSESVILNDVGLCCSLSTDLMQPRWMGPFRYHIPAGSRIAARAQSQITDADDRLFDVVLYGAH